MVVLTMVCFGITLYQFFNPVKDNVVQNKENLNLNENNEINISDKKTEFSLKNEVSVLNEKITYESDKLKVVFNANSGDISNIFIKTSDDKSFDIVKGNVLNNALKLKLGSWKDGVDLNTLFNKDSIDFRRMQGYNIVTNIADDHFSFIFHLSFLCRTPVLSGQQHRGFSI